MNLFAVDNGRVAYILNDRKLDELADDERGGLNWLETDEPVEIGMTFNAGALGDAATSGEQIALIKRACIKVFDRWVEGARRRVAGTGDFAKMSVYNQRAVYAREIVTGAATDKQIETAKREAVRLGLAATIADADAAVMAAIWIEKDEALGVAAAELDQRRDDAIAAIDGAANADAVKQELLDQISAGDAWVDAL